MHDSVTTNACRPVSRIYGLFSAFALCLITMAYATDGQAQTAERPNILFFLADDMGWGDTRVNNPNSRVPMPNLEKLAEQGMNFSDAHTSGAKCAPTRYSALSGNYHWRGRLPWGHWPWFGGSQFLDGQISMADVLKAAGYRTAMIGKMHLGGNIYKRNSSEFADYRTPVEELDIGRGMKNGPRTYGFDYTFTAPRGLQKEPYAYFENDNLVGDVASLFEWQAGTYGRSEIIETGIGMPYFDTSETGPVLLENALNYIDRHHTQNVTDGTDTPFFMYYASQSAHEPFTPPATMFGQQVDGATGTNAHLDMIYELDVALGALISALEQRGLADNTLIVFTSDNGGIASAADRALGHNMGGGLRGAKGQIWEGGHRVPFVARWGDGTAAGSQIPPGSESDQMIGLHDLIATFASVVEKPLAADQARDSFDFLPVLKGQQPTGTPVRDHLIMEADVVDGVQGPRQFAYREGDWKLIFTPEEIPQNLFNLASDPSESLDLINDTANAERVRQMTSRFNLRYASERTAPLGEASLSCGRPVINPTIDRELFVWRDCGTNRWHVAATSGDDSATGQRVLPLFQGAIKSDRPITSVDDSTVSLESSDSVRLTLGDRRVNFQLRLASGSGATDEFSFVAKPGADMCLTIQFEDAERRVLFGQRRRPVERQFPLNLKTGKQCQATTLPVPPVACGSPDINLATDRGMFLWIDCATTRWHLTATGGQTVPGNNPSDSRYKGSLVFPQNIRGLFSNTLEAPFDHYNNVGNLLQFRMATTSGMNAVDDIIFTAPVDSSVCVRPSADTLPRAVFVGPERTRYTDFPLALGDPNICP